MRPNFNKNFAQKSPYKSQPCIKLTDQKRTVEKRAKCAFQTCTKRESGNHRRWPIDWIGYQEKLVRNTNSFARKVASALWVPYGSTLVNYYYIKPFRPL